MWLVTTLPVTSSPAPPRSSDRSPCSRAWLHPRRPKSGHITCYKHRTYYVLTTTAYPSVTTCALPDSLVTVSPWITPRKCSLCMDEKLASSLAIKTVNDKGHYHPLPPRITRLDRVVQHEHAI